MKFQCIPDNLISDSRKTAFRDIITLSHGIIVNYSNQRPYVWSSREINQLLYDLYDAYVDYDAGVELSSYFLQDIILSNYDNHRSPAKLVDGQQRITTMTLLAHYLIQRLGLTGTPLKRWLISNQLNDYAFKIDGFNFDNDDFLKLIKKFKKTIADDSDEDDDDNKSLTCINAIVIIDSFFLDKPNVDFFKYFTWLLNNTFMKVSELLDESKELALFIDINSKGKVVSNVDKIKNVLLDNISDSSQRQVVIDKWKKFDKKINQLTNKGYKQKSANAGDIKETIFRDIAKIAKSEVNFIYKKSTMFEDFVKRYTNYEEIVKLIDHAIAYVDDMINYIYNPKAKYRTPTILLKKLKIKTFVTTIMYAKEYSVDVDSCLDILSRIILFSITNSKTYKQNTLEEFHKRIKTGDLQVVKDWYNTLVYNLSDVDISKQLRYTKQNSRIHSVLVFMEANMRSSNYLKTINDEDLFSKFNIEHICAKGDNKDKNSWINGFGNLTLLHGSKNSSLQDRMENKPGAYKECVKENILSKIIATTNADDFITTGVNKKYLEMITPYTEDEIINWNEELSNKRSSEMITLYKELLKIK